MTSNRRKPFFFKSFELTNVLVYLEVPIFQVNVPGCFRESAEVKKKIITFRLTLCLQIKKLQFANI